MRKHTAKFLWFPFNVFLELQWRICFVLSFSGHFTGRQFFSVKWLRLHCRSALTAPALLCLHFELRRIWSVKLSPYWIHTVSLLILIPILYRNWVCKNYILLCRLIEHFNTDQSGTKIIFNATLKLNLVQKTRNTS